MKQYACLFATCIAAIALAGCPQATPGEKRALGSVDYQLAFDTAQKVLSQYFSVESADRETGLIQSRPKSLDMEKNRLLGGSAARQVAVMRLRRSGDQVVAQVCVEVQTQGGEIHSAMPRTGENYSTVPNETPAQGEAATSAEQNDAWRTDRYAHDLERKILDDLCMALGARAAPQTQTAPAKGN